MPGAELPSLPGICSAQDLSDTAGYILHCQQENGAIPWYPGGRIDPWDHIECAMALAVCGHHDAARRAYTWVARQQRGDGSLPSKVPSGASVLAETHHAAYLAVGVWHYVLLTADEAFARALWPAVRRGIEFTLRLRTDRGEVVWAQDPAGGPADHALLTGCSSIYHSLRCAAALGDRLGEPQLEWELASAQLGHLIGEHEDVFADRSRFAMDWYYPILGGAVSGAAAHRRLDERWATFAVPGRGIRCVSDQPWVTGAETCELVVALAALGETARGTELFAAMQHLRDADDGAYWTGYQFAEHVRWPVERSTWTSAAVILAADALCGATAGAGAFALEPRGEEPVDHTACGCAPYRLPSARHT